jgi:hypothetical protein
MMLSINLSTLDNRGYEISVIWRVARMEILLAMSRVLTGSSRRIGQFADELPKSGKKSSNWPIRHFAELGATDRMITAKQGVE